MSQGIAYLSENKTPAKKNMVRTNRSNTEAISSVLLETSGRFLARNFSIDPVSTFKNSSVPTLSHPDASILLYRYLVCQYYANFEVFSKTGYFF